MCSAESSPLHLRLLEKPCHPKLLILTTGHIKIAGLLVKREQRQVHGTGASQRHPYTVQDVAIWKYSNVEIWLQNIVKSADFLVSEKCVRHPNFGGIGHRQISDFVWKRKLKIP